ncbi:MAG: hypothetical protein A2X48_13005 [Lentisphaerae bacterium GWF2_49_21]|nr:MAG: hypothetical protein A2X48_13005 [Lentisphaerae bacterium GWF2_49_21]
MKTVKKYQDCYVKSDNQSLVIGNKVIERKWDFSSHYPVAVSLRHKLEKREWIVSSADALGPALSSSWFSCQAEITNDMGISAKHLKAEIRLKMDGVQISWFHCIWPKLPIVVSQFFIKGLVDKNSELIDKLINELEKFKIYRLHMGWKSVGFFSRTDRHDNPVREQCGFVHAQEKLSIPGHFFHLFDQRRSSGLLGVKLAPAPDEQLSYPGADFVLNQGGVHICGSGIGYGDLKASDTISSYSWAVGLTSGTAANAAELFYQLQKIQNTCPFRKPVLFANNWGGGATVDFPNQKNIEKELANAEKLGITHYQIDAGWQQGNARKIGVEKCNPVSPYKLDPNFWNLDKNKFPQGIPKPNNIAIGLWFVPDSSKDFANWAKDYDQILVLWKKYRITHFKFDGVAINSKKGERNFQNLIRCIYQVSGGKIQLYLDITGGESCRPGFAGSSGLITLLFFENRYTGVQTYYPYRTLRNLWRLAKYFPTYRLLIEWLNVDRHRENYNNDSLAPGNCGMEYSLAVSLFALPLAWFRTSELSEKNRKRCREILSEYLPHQQEILRGRVFPIGDEPDGYSWTGFQSVFSRQSGYLLFYRELNSNPNRNFSLNIDEKPNSLTFKHILSSEKVALEQIGNAAVRITLPKKNSFALFKYETIGQSK